MLIGFIYILSLYVLFNITGSVAFRQRYYFYPDLKNQEIIVQYWWF